MRRWYLIGLFIVFLCGDLQAQNFQVHVIRPSATQNFHVEVIQPTNVKLPVSIPLAISVTFGCSPCERLKADCAAGKFQGFDVRYTTDWEPRVYPAIRYPTKTSATGWGVIYGYSGQSTIDKLKLLTDFENPQIAMKAATSTVIETPVAERTTSMLHSDLVSLHNSLHGGGQWTWPGDLTDHLQQAHNVDMRRTAFQSLVRRRNYNGRSCASGRCPVW
jgi:hypothetical protein